jgi:hypothetical protein
LPNYTPSLDTNDLLDWNTVLETEMRWTGLLLGNGASRAVWDEFSYPSLYDRARSVQIANPLAAEDEALFAAFTTRNFERVLGSLKTAGTVARALGQSDSEIRTRYDHVQHALFEAVGSVHVPWEQVAGDTLRSIRSALRAYPAVYSTNYDLLVYWAIMHEDEGAGFKDFFWGADHTFDPKDTAVSGNATLIYYLHGGTHLRALVDGGTRKHVAELGALLDAFPTSFESDDVPLLVSEGTAEDKLAAVLRSDYLSFAYGRLAEHTGGLVIFGQSLSDEDSHLVDLINTWREPWREPTPNIAISIRRTADPDEVRLEKLRYAALLPYVDLFFFDPDTHPLGQPHVRPD